MPIYPNFYQTLSACPIVELRGYAAACGLKGRLYAYLDFAGPTGTARDGLAEGMLALAIEKKKLISGQPIIEAASGPFAAALTLAGLTAGHPVVLVMPEDAPALRQETLLRLGAQIRHSPARSGVNGARRLAAQTAAANGWYYMDWLANDDNPEYHRRVTGPAIVQSIAREGKSAVDAIVIGVGSGGTVTGVGETIKAWTNDVRIAAVEPYESQALGGGLTGPHGISDLGYGFVPENFNAYVVDNVVAVNTTDAQRAAQKVLRTDAIPASVSAGAALHAAAQLLAEGKPFPHPAGELVVTPHPGEMARLTGLSAAALANDRAGIALRYAKAWNAVVVLKGARTVVASPDGRVCVNPTGNPGLARGGSGDVLAGMLAALLACGLPAYEAAACAVYLHGAAADRSAAKRGEYGMLPHDILPELGALFAENQR